MFTYWCVILADPDVKDTVTNFVFGPRKATIPVSGDNHHLSAPKLGMFKF